jgi:CMP/dCMP kinase
VKIYLDASVEVRAHRRFKEYREMGKNVDEKAIGEQIVLRDSEDAGRPYGALCQADDAVYLDSSTLTREEVIQKVIGIIGCNPLTGCD